MKPCVHNNEKLGLLEWHLRVIPLGCFSFKFRKWQNSELMFSWIWSRSEWLNPDCRINEFYVHTLHPMHHVFGFTDRALHFFTSPKKTNTLHILNSKQVRVIMFPFCWNISLFVGREKMTEDTLFKFQFSFDPKHCYMARSCKAEYSLVLTVRTNGIRRGSWLLRVRVYNF